MTHSCADEPASKKQSKTPHRRATTDASFLSRPVSRRTMERRRSLPILMKSVHFSELSEVCVVDPSPPKRWYTGEDHLRFKRERISDVATFREMSRRGATGRPGPSSAAASSSSSSSSSSFSSGPQEADTSGSSCPVGLEQLLSTRGMVEAQVGRKVVIRSVLLEQNRQRCRGVRDPDQIAYLSVRLSADALEAGQKRGKFQEMAKFV